MEKEEESKQDLVRAYITRTDSLEEEVTRRFNNVQGQINYLGTNMDEKFAKVDQRFEQIDERFKQIDQRFEQIDQRFEQIDQKFEQIDKRFDRMEERFDKLEKKLDLVIEELRSLNRRVTALEDWRNTFQQ